MLQIKKKAFSATDAMIASFHNTRYLVPLHIHQFSELIYVLDGELTVTTSGKNETAKKGDIAIIQPFQPHRYYTNEGHNVHLWMILFSNAIIDDMNPVGANKYVFEKSVFTPSEELKRFIEKRMIDTNEEKVYLDKTTLRKLKVLLYPIFDEYIDNVPLANETRKLKANSIAEAMIYISEHFKENIDLDYVSSQIGYSRSHISHSLSTMLSLNFRDVINMFRVEHAKNLILTTNLSMYLVGLESGFISERTFHRAFQKTIGCTPLEYKKRHERSV